MQKENRVRVYEIWRKKKKNVFRMLNSAGKYFGLGRKFVHYLTTVRDLHRGKAK